MKKRILIAGAGFAGLVAARKLARMQHHLDIEVMLVSARENFTFTPRLIDVLEGTLKPEDVSAALVPLSKQLGFQFTQAEVLSVDRARREVRLRLPDGTDTDMSYDIFILCPGAKTNFYGIEGAETFGLPLKSLEDVVDIKRRLAKQVQLAVAETDIVKRKLLLSIAVVGAGATGVEALFAIKVLIEDLLKEQGQTPLTSDCSYSLLQAAPQILTGFVPAVVSFARQQLQYMGAVVYLGTPVNRVDAEGLRLADGRMVQAALVIWSAGLAPVPLEITPPIDIAKGNWLQSDSCLRISDDFFLGGDISAFSYQGATVPKNAQTAQGMGMCLAKNVARVLQGKMTKPYHYFSKGVILVTGKTGAVNLKYITLSGPWVNVLRRKFYDFMHAGLVK